MRPSNSWVGRWTALLLLLLAPYCAWADEITWPQRKTDGLPSRFDWSESPTYWRKWRNDPDFLLLRPEGLVWGTLWKNGRITYFLAHWKAVAEIAGPKDRPQFLMAVDEHYCGGGFLHHHATFRLLDVWYDKTPPLLSIDVATGIHPPPSPLDVGNDALWDVFEAGARASNYKDEGPFEPSSRDDMPQWFRKLVAETWDKGRFDCEYVPPPVRDGE